MLPTRLYTLDYVFVLILILSLSCCPTRRRVEEVLCLLCYISFLSSNLTNSSKLDAVGFGLWSIFVSSVENCLFTYNLVSNQSKQKQLQVLLNMQYFRFYLYYKSPSSVSFVCILFFVLLLQTK